MDFKKFGFDDARLEKRETMLAEGAELYPYSYEDCTKINKITDKAKRQENAGEEITAEGKIAGRIWAVRKMGRTVFMDLRDDTGKIQLYINNRPFSKQEFKRIAQLDMGDIIGVEGPAFRTKMGELSIKVKKLTILAKTVVNIPMGKETDDKVFYRSSDTETKYRERYLHWMLDSNDRERIKKRFQIFTSIRKHMENAGFLEVTTPTIEFIYGGAEARPFKTSIWALNNKDAFLRISPELYLKRYIVAGFEKVYTICQNFRNEGIDATHNPEFTMMEWYEAYTDYNTQMERLERLIENVCKDVCGTAKITYQGTELDFTAPWKRMSMLEAVRVFAGINADNMSVDEIKSELDKHNIEYDPSINWGLGVVELFENLCEEHIVQPTFIIDHPIEVSPLTKIKRGDDRLVERFEPLVYGIELANAYSELTDPVKQMERFVQQREIQQHSQDKGQDWEDNPIDNDFIKAIGCGMPPTGGLGIGIDR
ncbi:MAG: lysine--tRNA ligase, partial [Victivallales bacterium]|nr:lysine--tRNA ligase [Victivallales bacterium]